MTERCKWAEPKSVMISWNYGEVPGRVFSVSPHMDQPLSNKEKRSWQRATRRMWKEECERLELAIKRRLGEWPICPICDLAVDLFWDDVIDGTKAAKFVCRHCAQPQIKLPPADSLAGLASSPVSIDDFDAAFTRYLPDVTATLNQVSDARKIAAMMENVRRFEDEEYVRHFRSGNRPSKTQDRDAKFNKAIADQLGADVPSSDGVEKDEAEAELAGIQRIYEGTQFVEWPSPTLVRYMKLIRKLNAVSDSEVYAGREDQFEHISNILANRGYDPEKQPEFRKFLTGPVRMDIGNWTYVADKDRVWVEKR